MILKRIFKTNNYHELIKALSDLQTYMLCLIKLVTMSK